MSSKYALLLDGGVLVKQLRARLKRAATPQDVMAECSRLRAHPELRQRELLHIYYYDAPPASGELVNPLTGRTENLGRSEVFKAAEAFQYELELCPNVALRLGEVAVRGWKMREGALGELAKTGRSLRAEDLRPDLQQKGVDLRIGLDMARLSLRQLVDVIVVVTADSDFVPAFKFARREGVRVCLDRLGATWVKRELRAHVDLLF